MKEKVKMSKEEELNIEEFIRATSHKLEAYLRAIKLNEFFEAIIEHTRNWRLAGDDKGYESIVAHFHTDWITHATLFEGIYLEEYTSSEWPSLIGGGPFFTLEFNTDKYTIDVQYIIKIDEHNSEIEDKADVKAATNSTFTHDFNQINDEESKFKIQGILALGRK